LVLAGKHSKEVPKGESPPLVSLVERFGHASVFLSAMFCSPLVYMRPPTLLAAILWLSCCLLRPESSSVIGAWSSRARVFYTLWATRDGHIPHLLLCLGGAWGFLVLGCCRESFDGTRAVSDGVFFGQ